MEKMKAELEKLLKWYKEEVPKKLEHLKSLNLNLSEERLQELSRQFEWHEVGIRPQKLNELVEKGILKIVYKSGKHTDYTLNIPIEELEMMVSGMDSIMKPDQSKVELDNLFSKIVGYDDIKEALKLVVQADKPLGVIIWGPPATAKSLFLEDLYHYYGSDSEFIVGSDFSAAGLAKLILEREPKAIIIDEVEKAKPQELFSLVQIPCTSQIDFYLGDRDPASEGRVVPVSSRLLGSVAGDFSGDGSGYCLTITKHYRSNPKKRDFR